MYSFLKFIFVAMILILGLIMFLCPKISTKKELRDSEEAVSKTKKSGLILSIVGFLVLAFLILKEFMM
ncbi:MAG TPA: hypothetical protein PKK61_13665 [Defluviitaleaceae bacterium]|nr:hypothetical protein [Defluviitaleaceae bacterium]